MGRVVLVTGASMPFANRVARALSQDPRVERVVAVDTVLPTGDLSGVKFVRADIRTSVIGKVLAVEDVDTVVHLDLRPSQRGGRAAGKELNVIGTMQLLAACQRSQVVSKLVVGSSTAVYGCSPRDPAMFRESTVPRAGVRTGFPKDINDVEAYVRAFARRRPDVLITTVRSAPFLDPQLGSTLSDYFSNPVLPAALGYDPRLQFVDAHDLRAVLVHAVVDDRPGTFNVAGAGVMLLSQGARRLGKPIVWLPAVGFALGARQVLRAFGSDVSPGLHRLLMYGRAVDTSALHEVFGYEPTHTTEQVFEEFRSATGAGMLSGRGGRR